MQKVRLRLLLLVLLICSGMQAQVQQVFDSSVRTLRVVVEGDPTLPPFLALGKHQHLEISWDEMSHNYHRYVYHIQHCDADWQPSEEIFESDYLAGMNGQPVEDYEKSFNTTQIYTHYSLRLPNAEAAPLLSGNYRVRIFHEDDDVDEATPVLEAQFCVYENVAGVRTTVSSNTDIDFNQRHQQVSLAVNYGTLNVLDPQRELRVKVQQNRRTDNMVDSLIPNIRRAGGVEFTHNRKLIFPAGNEYHRFEIVDVHRASLGVDQMEWFEPYYHASLFSNKVSNSYTYIEDQNGVYVPRSEEEGAEATTAEYVVVHFFLDTPRLPGGDVYVCGLWTGVPFREDCRMEYDQTEQRYHAAIMLKQGYYSYQYVQPDGGTARTMGNFYETENEYSTLVYYRGQGARYDRLVGYQRVHLRQR